MKKLVAMFLVLLGVIFITSAQIRTFNDSADRFEEVAEIEIKVNVVAPAISDFIKEKGALDSFIMIEPKMINFDIFCCPETVSKVVIFRVKDRGITESEEIVEFIKKCGGKMPNARGLVFIWKEFNRFLPRPSENAILGFDAPDNLYSERRGCLKTLHYCVPFMYYKVEAEKWCFDFGYWDRGVPRGSYFVFFV